MGTWYTIYGEMTVRDCPEVRELIATDDGVLIDNKDFVEVIDPIENGTLTLEINFSDACSYGTVHDIDSALEEFGPYVVDPVLLHWELESDRGKLYIGPPEREHELQSKNALDEILLLIGELTDEDKTELKWRL